MDNIEIYRRIQQLSRAVQAIRAPLTRIIELAWRGSEVPLDKEAVIHVLRHETAQRELASEWETLIYRHVSGQFCLITTALPSDPKDALVLTQRRLLNSRESCSFCGLVEGSYAPLELVVATSPVGQPIPYERVHKRCSLSWQRLQLIAAQTPTKQRESLL